MLYYASKTPLLNETQRQLERAGCGRDRTPVFPKMPIFINVVLIMFVLFRLFRCPMHARIQNPLAGLLLDGRHMEPSFVCMSDSVISVGKKAYSNPSYRSTFHNNIFPVKANPKK